MATEQQYIVGGNGARTSASQVCTLVVNGNTTVKGQIVVPANSWLKSIAVETPVAITGTPASCNVNIGTTDGGTDIMAATAAGSQGHVAGTLTAAFDKILGLASLTTLYVQVVTAGGTSSAGTINVLVSYDPPSR